MARCVLLLLAVCLTACSVTPPSAPIANAAQVAHAPGVGGASLASRPGRPEPVTLWQDQSIFKLVGRLIATARTDVMVEMYELGRRDIIYALGAAHARGVAVRVITDPTVRASRRSAAVLDNLGVPERVYPVDDVRHQIDHVKLLIADGEAVVGGMNWGLAGGEPAPLAAAPSEIAQTAPGEEIRAMLEGALGGARFRVLAEVYTLTDAEVMAGLAAAHRRG